MYIYKITNKINGKIYVGQTTKTIEQRLAKHWSEAKCESRPNNYFHNAMLKYGIDSFTIEKLDEASDIEELNKKEIYWIDKLQSTDKSIGYNLMTGGKSGLKPEESREKIRQKKLLNWDDEKLRDRMLEGLRLGTKAWQNKCMSNRILFVCPQCGKEMLLQKNEYEKKRFCSLDCAIRAGVMRENAIKSSKIAADLATKRRKTRNESVRLVIKSWITDNMDLIQSCKFNKISTTLNPLQKFMFEKYGIEDWRSIGLAICDNPSKKELLKYLKSECENICCSGLN